MDNNERFKILYIELEEYLISICKNTDYLYQYIESNPSKSNTDRYTFFECLRAILKTTNGSSEKIKNIRSFQSKINKIKEKYDFLDYIRILRNKLSHEIGWFEITDKCLNELELLCDFLFRIKIKDTESIPKQVKYCNENESLYSVLAIMYENTYTHIPVISDTGEITGVLSDAIITVWLREQIDDNYEIILDTKLVTLKMLIKIETKYEEYLVLSDNELTSIAYSKFEEYVLKGNRLGCIIFTKDGKNTSSITGIMTAWDLPIIKEYFMLNVTYKN